METKICSMCKRELSLDNFYKHSKTADGLQSACKDCQKERSKMQVRRRNEIIKKINDENPLSAYTPRQLIEELRARGYKGQLTYEYKVVL